MVELTWVEALPACPDRPDDGHKGTFGTVAVVGGNATMPGAAALTATAALRGGAGLAKIVAPPKVLPAVLALQPSATGLTFDDVAELRGDGRTVLAIGPGLGRGRKVPGFVNAFLDWENPLVVDADGLNALPECGTVRPADRPWVLTPHPGEFRRLAEAYEVDGDPTDPDARPGAAAALARATDAVVVLKGRHTIVSDGERAYRNATGNPALATAGSGDVLTGVVASLLAQGMDAFEAAVLAVYLHGDAADAWAAVHGRSGMLAMELADGLPGAFERRRRVEPRG
ncbi:MAG: NAD(P)H-hydrate dehydratase [Planctomycetota bacterium]